MSEQKSRGYLLNAFLVLIICVSLGIIGIYFIRDIGTVDVPNANATIHLGEKVSADSEYYYYVNDAGLYGIATSDGEVLLPAEWTSLSALQDDSTRFFATNLANGRKQGIIDLEGNLVSPYIYTEIRRMTDTLIIGYTSEKGKAILLSGSGNRYANEEWDSIQYYENGYITLTKNNYSYSASVSNGKLIIRTIVYDKTFNGNNMRISILPTTTLAQVNFNSYDNIISRSTDFVSAIFIKNRTEFQQYCTEEFKEPMLELHDFEDARLEDIEYINPQIEEIGGEMTYKATVHFNAQVPLHPSNEPSEEELENGEETSYNPTYISSKFILYIFFEYGENGKLLISGYEFSV